MMNILVLHMFDMNQDTTCEKPIEGISPDKLILRLLSF